LTEIQKSFTGISQDHHTTMTNPYSRFMYFEPRRISLRILLIFYDNLTTTILYINE
jgi:hypothetical protein